MRFRPTPSRNSDSTQRFQTYRFYVRSLAGLTGIPHALIATESTYPTLSARVIAMASCRPPQTTRSVDYAALKRSLTSAWATALLLSLSSEYAVEDELLRMTNNWAAVQLYYVFYHVTQALIVARGDTRPEDHSKTKSRFLDMWVDRSLDCPPWTLGFKQQPIGVPAAHVVDPRITTVARPKNVTDYLNYVFKALDTTRREAFPQALKTRREAKRKLLKQGWDKAEADRLRRNLRPRTQPTFPLPTLTADESTLVRANVRCHSIMDLLWRLRTRTNYADGLMFIDGPVDEESTRELNADMRSLASTTMLLYELHLRECLGRDRMRELTTEWLDRYRGGSVAGLGQRLQFVLG